jgi:predicted AlkP superfamily phosphohydrolase/phosphomutase
MSEDRRVKRIAVFGLDGADFRLLQPWLEDGSLPCLSRLYRQGASGLLASTVPPLSPEAWASFATGVNPGRHGVVNFVQPKPGSYELQFSCGGIRRGRSLWRLLSEAGLTVGVANVPMTYPPEAVNGFLVSGPDAPGTQADFTYPGDLKEKLLSAVGKYDIHGDYWGRTTPEGYLQRLVATVENQKRAWEYLLKSYQPDVFIGVFGSTDRAQHFLWKYADPAHPAHQPHPPFGDRDALAAVYRAVDSAIADCLSLMGEEVTVIIMSDHGSGPCHKVVYLDRWLQSQGLLSYRREGVRWHRRLARRSYGLARRSLPRWAKDWLKTRWQGVREELESSIIRDPIDWESTRAFFLGTESAYIYLNTQHRFPQGTVRPGAEAEALCDEIADGLSEILDPETGMPVVEAVHRRDDIYSGPRDQLALLPDLVVQWRDSEYVVRRAWGEPKASPDVTVERGIKVGDAARLMSLELSGSHRPEGILIAAGPGVPAGREISGANIMDLAPTILSLLGIPTPSDMDGRALPELPLTAGIAQAPKTTDPRGPAADEPAAPYSEAEKEEMEQRLRGLGYMD